MDGLQRIDHSKLNLEMNLMSQDMVLERTAEPEVEAVCNLSLKERIVRYLKSRQYVTGEYAWVNGGEIERLSLAAGYKASNGSRRLRELHVERVLDRDETEKGSVKYRYSSKF